MNQGDEIISWIKIGFFVLIGLGFGFMFWHSSQNDYVSKFDYDILNDKYQLELEKNEDLKQDMAELLIESYTKPFVWDIFGITRHKKVVCALNILLKEDIPIINELLC